VCVCVSVCIRVIVVIHHV